jgi:hypothetical protein
MAFVLDIAGNPIKSRQTVSRSSFGSGPYNDVINAVNPAATLLFPDCYTTENIGVGGNAGNGKLYGQIPDATHLQWVSDKDIVDTYGRIRGFQVVEYTSALRAIMVVISPALPAGAGNADVLVTPPAGLSVLDAQILYLGWPPSNGYRQWHRWTALDATHMRCAFDTDPTYGAGCIAACQLAWA